MADPVLAARTIVLAADRRCTQIAVQHHGSGGDGLDEAFEEAGETVTGVAILTEPAAARGDA